MIALRHTDEDDARCGARTATQHGRQTDDEPALDFSIYLRELRRTPLLTAAEEVTLAQAVEAGIAARGAIPGVDDAETRATFDSVARAGDAAYHKLVESNLRLVVSIARRFTGRGVDLVDLIQEGNLGLHHAVGKYDWRRGTRFSTYATWWIRQAVHRGLNDHGRPIRLPARLAEQMTDARHALQQLEQELGRVPTLAEQRDRLEPAARKIAALSGVIERPISMDTPVRDDAYLADILAGPSTDDPAVIVEHQQGASDLDALLTTTLLPREALVIRLRYGLGPFPGYSLVEIGAALSVTRERARQIEVASLRKLRQSALIRRHFGLSAP